MLASAFALATDSSLFDSGAMICCKQAMERNAGHVADYPKLPHNGVVEIGRQIAIWCGRFLRSRNNLASAGNPQLCQNASSSLAVQEAHRREGRHLA